MFFTRPSNEKEYSLCIDKEMIIGNNLVFYSLDLYFFFKIKNVLIFFFHSNFGVSTLMENEWVRLNVPCVLRTFWILRVLEHAISLLADWWRNSQHNVSDPSLAASPLSFESFPSPLLIIKSILISGCETLTALLGMTSVVSYICHYIGRVFQWVSTSIFLVTSGLWGATSLFVSNS